MSKEQPELINTLEAEDRGYVEGGAAAFNAEKTRILTWNDSTLRLWDTLTGEAIVPPIDHQTGVKGAVLNADGTRILSWGEDNQLRLWHPPDADPVTFDHESTVLGAAFDSNPTRIVSWSEDRTIRLWDHTSTPPTVVQKYENIERKSSLFNAHASRILSWNYRHLLLRDLVNVDIPIWKQNIDDNRIGGALFGTDATRFLTWTNNSTKLWDASKSIPVEIAELDIEGYMRGAVFNASSTRLLLWSENGDDEMIGKIQLWDVMTGGLVMDLDQQRGQGVAFSNDETQILSWRDDDTLHRWDIPNSDASADELKRLIQVRTSMRQSATGDVEAIPVGEWRAIKASLAESKL